MIKQISVFLENRAGTLSKITELLAQNSLDLRALLIAETSDYGVLRIIVSDPDKAAELLRENGMPIDITEVQAVSVPDKPGGLSQILKILSDKGIDVSYMYSMFGKDNGKAYMIFKVPNPDGFKKALAENGIKTEELNDIK